MSVLGHVGLRGGLWLADGGGGECERGTAGCLGRPGTGVRAATLFFW
jgi:hypothetical protein